MHVHLVASLFRLMTVPLLSLARFNDLKIVIFLARTWTGFSDLRLFEISNPGCSDFSFARLYYRSAPFTVNNLRHFHHSFPTRIVDAHLGREIVAKFL